MNKTMVLALSALLALSGCDDDGGDPDSGPGSDSGPGGDTDSGAPLDSGAADVDSGPPADSGPIDSDSGPTGAAHCGGDSLIIQAVEPGVSITLFNPTTAPITIAGGAFLMCSRPAYPMLDSLNPTVDPVPPGGTTQIDWVGADDVGAGEMAIYDGSFGDRDNMRDFVCWGTGRAGPTRRGDAQMVGLWSGDCAAAITGGTLTREPGTDGTSAASYDSTGGSAALSCP